MASLVNEANLTEVLSEFARTVITDFPIQRILEHLVDRIVDVLPIDSAGVTLIDDGRAPHYIAASNPDAFEFERLQSSLRQGPCIEAFTTGQPVLVPDLVADGRFPLFAEAAGAAGLAAAFTFPLHHGDEQLGALDLYRTTPGPLSEVAVRAAQTLGDVAAAYLLNARARLEAAVTSERLLHLSMHDPLTGLPNRLLLQERIEQAARRAERTHTNAAVLFADLDGFKTVNDTYGHDVGDLLLCAVADRLAGLLRPAETLARVSGDEFVILCEDLTSVDDADGLAARIQDTMKAPFMVAALQLLATASIGIAFTGPGDRISNQMVIDADRAMYSAKRAGGQGRVVTGTRRADRDQRHNLKHDLQHALATDELELLYQPIVRTGDGTVTGVEALLRWKHDQLGDIHPLRVVALAEQTGVIDQLGSWVLDRACKDYGGWLRSARAVNGGGAADVDLAVNVSARQFVRPRFAQTVVEAVECAGLEPGCLVLELTEGVLIDDSDQVMGGLDDLRAAGIRLAIDDFGTGYSSLSYLIRLPIDIIKVDRSFVVASASPRGRMVVSAITDLAHDLGMAVVAEGVETDRQHADIVSLGCEAAQGYLYARPMDASAVGAHLRDRLLPWSS